jgi:hypothetical protein
MAVPSKPVFPAAGSRPDSLSIREYFAAVALQGILAGTWALTRQGIAADAAAKKAVEYADALIAQLK